MSSEDRNPNLGKQNNGNSKGTAMYERKETAKREIYTFPAIARRKTLSPPFSLARSPVTPKFRPNKCLQKQNRSLFYLFPRSSRGESVAECMGKVSPLSPLLFL
ncbi:unnamed protein product [Microthlaspi erraticum]|uniref:Uncharacterized protein n=1 Tax=Microthlaspi erraticum TaxID=1685480 RepID=A0A6D2IB47_9BRAS|nr:unnamed protein product [Microthlaspi erraticum]